jgi:tellurite resistance protein TerC
MDFFISMIFMHFAVPRLYQHRVLFWGILGLRALYFALATVVHRFHYLKYALAIVLIFIGAKIFLGDWLFDGKVPAALSLSVTAGLLAGGILFSLWKTRGQGATALEDARQ